MDYQSVSIGGTAWLFMFIMVFTQCRMDKTLTSIERSLNKIQSCQQVKIPTPRK